MNTGAIYAIFKRDFKSYFVSLKGYVFVVAFVALAVMILFGEEFFVRNSADLALLNEPREGIRLPVFFLLLVFFVPAITMSSWAQEREQGTDQLLLTLPALDWEIVLAKFLACFGVYSVALFFTLTNVLVVAYLGDPDWGSMFANYVGYWLMGAAAIALGMLGSALTRSLTTAWLLGGLLIGLPAVPTLAATRVDLATDATLLTSLFKLWNDLGAQERFEGFGLGMIYGADFLYFAGITVIALYANAYVLGRRHWTVDKGPAVHGAIRLASISLSLLCMVVLSLRMVIGLDLTEAKMLSVRPEARAVIERLLEKDEKDSDVYKLPPVLIQAWISPKGKTPDDYLPVRRGLIQLLKEIDRRAGEQVKLAIYETDLYSPEAERAERDFGIQPTRVQALRGRIMVTEELFMGLVFTCGEREVKIPFFTKGLPVQFELVRAIGSVAQLKQPKIGVLKTGAPLFGGFDFQTMRSSEDWRVLKDLRLQYEVKKIDASSAAIATDIKALVVPLPSTLPQPEMDRLYDYLYAGGKALILIDPLPSFDPNKAPVRPSGGGGNPFQQQRKPPSKPKGDIEAFLRGLGVTWHKDRIVWDSHNPHTQFADVPEELIFVAPADSTDPEGRSGFSDDVITSGMQEVVLIFSGELVDSSPPEITITPLLTTRSVSGYNVWADVMNEGFMGVNFKPPGSFPHNSKDERRVLAVKIEGTLAALKNGPGVKKGQRSAKTFQVVLVADLDVIGDTFYALRDQGATGGMDLSLDNVAFVCNSLDWLAGDLTYLELRKLRPKRRTLVALDHLRKAADEKQRKAEDEATKDAEKRLTEAQERLDEEVEKLKKREDLDHRTKQQMLFAAQEREQRRLDVEKEKIERDKGSKVRLSKTEKARQIAARQQSTRWAAISFAVLPVLFLGLIVLFRKATLEGTTMDPERRRVS
ncbi:MAG: Gldg family protein [Planctomycetes bacterium]|nr:Gldg family protein [Planctomycetota bacterium]